MTQVTEGFWKRRWKLILNIATVLALLVTAYAIRSQLKQTIHNLFHVHVWWLLLMVPIQFLDYHAQTKMYQKLFGIVGNKLGYWFLWKASLELNFVNHVFPSGGVTGLSYFSMRLKDGTNLSGTKATLTHVMKLALTILSFEALLMAGVLFLAAVGKVNNLVLLLAGSLTTLMIIGTLLFSYIIGSKQRIGAFFVSVTRGINRLIRVVRPMHPDTFDIDKAHAIFDEFHGYYMEFRKHRQELRAPFFWALIANIAEVGTLYVVYVAFDHWVNVGAVILAYGVANFAGLVSVLPGGVGVYEALMTAVLSAGGVPAGLSLPVTVMYRVLNTVIQIPPGYVLYHRTLRGSRS